MTEGPAGANPSERFVQHLCRGTFLTPWCLENPLGKGRGKELCDLLIVCHPDIVIISVKDVEYRETQGVSTGLDRWVKRAVKASIRQIRGAERILSTRGAVTSGDGARVLTLPRMAERRIHRIAVAFGSKGEVPIAEGKPGEPFVHVFDETSVQIVMRELDTITDFVRFLRSTEELLEGTQVILSGVEDLLALYLHRGRNFPDDMDLLVLTDDMWSGISAREEFLRRKEADKESYLWDALIEHLAAERDPALSGPLRASADESCDGSEVMRIMAREDRFSRRILSKSFKEFHHGGGIRARVVVSPSGVGYVFLARPANYDRLARRNELLGRMFLVRGIRREVTTIVGIATEEYAPGQGSSIDCALLVKPDWTDEDQKAFDEIQAATGAFKAPVETPFHEDEYPDEPEVEQPG